MRVAMQRALTDAGLVAACSFDKIEWNKMALRAIVNWRNVDFFYRFRTRLSRARAIATWRTCVTGTSPP